MTQPKHGHRHEDAFVEHLARVTPPAGHEARVRARTGPLAGGRGEAAPRPAVPWRWVMPLAASVLVASGALWQSTRSAQRVELAPPVAAAGWSGKGLDVPVLPPRAYWEMSAFDEFDSLRGPVVSTPRTARIALPLAVAEAPPWTPLPPIVLAEITPSPITLPDITGLEPVALEPIQIDPIEIVPEDKEQR